MDWGRFCSIKDRITILKRKNIKTYLTANGEEETNSLIDVKLFEVEHK